MIRVRTQSSAGENEANGLCWAVEVEDVRHAKGLGRHEASNRCCNQVSAGAVRDNALVEWTGATEVRIGSV